MAKPLSDKMGLKNGVSLTTTPCTGGLCAPSIDPSVDASPAVAPPIPTTCDGEQRRRRPAASARLLDSVVFSASTPGGLLATSPRPAPPRRFPSIPRGGCRRPASLPPPLRLAPEVD